jgi:gluconokinase
MIVIFMGVSGSGKTTAGKAVANSLHWSFLDADDFHPKSNIDKMSRGEPLNDDDRFPWLTILAGKLANYHDRGESVILACSALKQDYRDRLNQCGTKPVWIYLRGSRELITARLNQRTGHFMSPALLGSQFQALEEPDDALVVDAGMDLSEQVALICRHLEMLTV